MRRLPMVLTVFAALVTSCSSPATSESQRVAAISGALPAISGATLTGGTITPADYRGKVVVLTFWNPDCPPCRKETAALRADWNALRPLGVRFISVLYVGGNWPKDLSGARQYVQQEGLSYPGVVDEGSRLARATHIPGIPVTIVADASGRMRYQILGGVKAGELIGLVSRLSQSD